MKYNKSSFYQKYLGEVLLPHKWWKHEANDEVLRQWYET